MLEIGTKAPDFELPDQNGEMHKLSDYAGKKVILYFYPKDNTDVYKRQILTMRAAVWHSSVSRCVNRIGLMPEAAFGLPLHRNY